MKRVINNNLLYLRLRLIIIIISQICLIYQLRAIVVKLLYRGKIIIIRLILMKLEKKVSLSNYLMRN